MRPMQGAKTAMKNERGFSIIEAMIASMILLVGIGGLMALFTIAAAKNAGQGNQATLCTEYAQDKMEQLLALQYTDTSSEVVGANTICGGATPCTGYNGTYAFGLTTGGAAGSSTTNAGGYVTPVVGYVDYVNQYDTTDTGGISPSANYSTYPAQYVREWQISTAVSNVKTITVYVQPLFTVAVSQKLAPNTTLIGMKQQY